MNDAQQCNFFARLLSWKWYLSWHEIIPNFVMTVSNDNFQFDHELNCADSWGSQLFGFEDICWEGKHFPKSGVRYNLSCHFVQDHSFILQNLRVSELTVDDGAQPVRYPHVRVADKILWAFTFSFFSFATTDTRENDGVFSLSYKSVSPQPMHFGTPTSFWLQCSLRISLTSSPYVHSVELLCQ